MNAISLVRPGARGNVRADQSGGTPRCPMVQGRVGVEAPSLRTADAVVCSAREERAVPYCVGAGGPGPGTPLRRASPQGERELRPPSPPLPPAPSPRRPGAGRRSPGPPAPSPRRPGAGRKMAVRRAVRRPPGRLGHHGVGGLLCLPLEAVRRIADLDPPGGRRARHRAGLLLDDVGELVRQHPAAVVGLGTVLVGLEHDVAAHGVRVRLHGLRRLRGPAVGVEPHVAEVVAQAGLHERLRRLLERASPAGREDILDR